VICSFIAVALTTIDFGSLFGEDDVDDTLNPNADLISEQETVVARNPDDVDAVTMLANLLGQTGSIAKAIPLYERALELAPGDTSIRLDFASSLAGAGYLADAESQFRLVLEADPDNQTAHYYLAELYMQTDPPRLDEARQHYARAAEIDPTSFLAERAEIKLTELGSSSPVASPESTPAG
jgi:Tfp pilus assembly protein PilF